MADKTATAETTATKKRQVSATIPADMHSDLEGYAYGTRRKLNAVVAEAVAEYYEKHKPEIDAKKVD